MADTESGNGKVVRALGDEDDHLRLTVLFADLARQMGLAVDAARTCLTPEARWAERRDALKALLAAPIGPLMLVDLDALYQGVVTGRAAWDDGDFRRERGEIFELVVQAAARHGWRLQRPAARGDVDSILSAAGLSQDAAVGRGRVPLELEHLKRGIEARGIRTREELDEELEAAEELTSDVGRGAPRIANHLIMLADEHLSAGARDAALRIGLLRNEVPWNGCVGPYDMDAGLATDAPHTFARADVEELVAMGLLIVNGDRSFMPRIVRRFYSRLSEQTGDVEAVAEHRWLGSWIASAPELDRIAGAVVRSIETHFHAVLGEDIDAAFATSRFYAHDVRLLAIRLSRRGGVGNHRNAASVFRRLANLDPDDAYAWEYYAYNLARANPHNRSEELRNEVAKAYARACQLDPGNPLYLGRFLGWRAQWGEEVVDQVRHQVLDYGTSGWAASWFAHQVITGMERGHQRHQLDRLAGDLGRDRIERWKNKERG